MSWRTASETAAQALFSTYNSCLALHRLMALLAIAEAVVPPSVGALMRARRKQLDELCRSPAARTGSLELAKIQSELHGLVRSVGLSKS
jgi:hypothetical protein